MIAALFLSALVQMSSWMLDKAEIAVIGLIDTLLSCPKASNATINWLEPERTALFQKGSPFFLALWTISIADELSDSSMRCIA